MEKNERCFLLILYMNIQTEQALIDIQQRKMLQQHAVTKLICSDVCFLL